jgi:hypothetical protein
MDGVWSFAWNALAIGAGATLVMDLWGWVQRRTLRISTLDYALVGRWLAGLPRGRIARPQLRAEPAVRGEAALGWAAHYATGVAFAALLLAIFGAAWVEAPSLGPALIVGLGTMAAPFFVVQPALGLGVAAARTPKPWIARLRTLGTHLSFALGLYLTALMMAATR